MSAQSSALQPDAELFPDRRVLIVDDDTDFAGSLSDLLVANGFVTETAQDGDQAIERCRAFDPPVAIVDIRLGGESGLDVIERLVEARPGLLCIVATAYAEVDTAVEAVRRGAYDYMRKPLENERMLIILGRAFERARLEEGKQAAEEALRASEARFRATFEQAAVGIAHVAPEGRFLRVNEKLCGMLGYTAEELAARTFRDVTHPDDISADVDRRPAMLAGTLATYSVEKRYLRKDGTVVWGNLTASLVRDEAGEPAYFIAVVEDISERKQQESERHDRETALGHAAELADLGHWVWDNVADICVFCSEKLAQIHGFATAEAYLSQAETRAGDLQLIHPEDRARYAAAEAEAYSTNSRFEVEYRIVLLDGEVRHMREVSELFRDADGTLIRTIGTTQDITAQNAAEAAIRESEARLRLITDSLPVLIAYFDTEERYQFVNETWTVWNARPAEEAVGRRLDELLGEDRYQGMRPMIERAFSGERQMFEDRIEYPDGRTRNIEVIYVPNAGPDGHVAGVFVMGHDVTERRRAQIALEEKNAEFQSFLDHAPAMVFLKDADGRYLTANREFERIFGTSDENLRGKLPSDIMPADIAQSSTDHDLDLIRTQRASTKEEVLVLDEEEHTLHTVNFPILNNEHNLAAIGTIATDITDLKKTEKALTESEARVRLITDSLPALIAYVDTDKRYRFANETWKRWNRLPGDEGIGKLMSDVLTAEHYAAVRPRIELALSGTSQSFEETVSYSDGRRRDIEIVFIPHHGPGGTIVGAFLMAQDTTERKRAEAALRTQELEFRIVMDNSPAAVFLKDMEGRFLQVNRRFEEWYGWAADDVLGKTSHDIYPKDYADAYTAQDREVLEGMRVIERDHQIPFADGNIRDIRVTKFPVLDPDGVCRGVATFNTDITEHRHTADQLRQAQKMEAVGQLTGGVAHDFNNLLAVVLGNAELADSEFGDGGPLSEYLGAVGKAAGRGAELTQRLLAFSRQQALRPKELDLGALAGGMTDLLRRTLGETIAIETHAAAETWKVEADPGQLENAILNLAINARDAMPSGGRLRIEARNATIDRGASGASAGLAPGDYVMLTVGDTGQGMPPEIVERAFDPFFTTKDVGKGSGLGLSMVYGFVKQSGGSVEIESDAGHGTTVRLYLPRAKGHLPRDGKSVPSRTPARGRGETVLVVEDDDAVRRLVVNILDGLGYRPIEAKDGLGALALLEETPYVDLLFSDMVLPGGMTGLEIAAQARHSRPGIKVLFMTGYTESRAELADMETALIEKPFRRAAVAEKVRAALDG